MSDPLRIAVIGVLGVGKRHAVNATKVRGGTLTAIVDTAPAAADVANELKVPLFKSVDELIAKKLADAVVCAVPHPLHRRLEVPCLEAGLDVLSEKPLAATPADAKAILDCAEKNNRTLGVVFQYRMRPAARQAKKLIDDGFLGDWYYASLHHCGHRWQKYYDERPWRGTWSGEGGAVLVNQGAHPIELMIQLVGEFPKRVVAINNHLRHKIQAEDISTSILEFPSGAQMTLHVDTIQPGENETYTIFGDKGLISFDRKQVTTRKYTPDIPSATADPTSKIAIANETIAPEGEDTAQAGVLQDFVDAVHEKRKPMVDGRWALKCVELHAAILMSAATGKAIDLPPNYEEYDALLVRLAREAK